MKEEVKIILNYLKKKENTRRIKCITIVESKQLLDYINNLQEENKELKDYLKIMEKSKDDNLNRFLDYKQRNEKAIEYIEKTMRIDDEYPNYMEMEICEYEELISILKEGKK